MKKISFNFGILLLFFCILYSCTGTHQLTSLKGRWYYVEGKLYKEIHANDSVFCLFNWNSDANRTLFLHYYINNDSLWSVYKISNPKEQMEPYCWGKIVKVAKEGISLKNDTSFMIFYKIDNADSLFTKKISQNLYVNHRLDSVQFYKWINYEDEYYKRMIAYYKQQGWIK